MSDVIVVSPTANAVIETLRNNVAEANVRAYGAEREYGIALCSVLPAEWYSVEHRDTSADAKLVHAEKKALFDVLKKANHTNPSTVWARVRKYAQEHIEGVPEKKEGESESAGAQPNRSLTLRFVEELTLLYKAGKRAESMSDKERAAHTYIASALGALGIDIGSL
jgi:hypothetical protein